AHRVVIEDAHAEAETAASDRAADPAEADHAEGLAVDVGAPQEVPFPRLPLSGARIGVGLDDPAGGGHQQREGEIGGGLGEDVGRVGDDDAASGGGGDVDVVVADGDVRDDLQVGRRGQHLVIDGGDDVADQAVLALKPLDELG